MVFIIEICYQASQKFEISFFFLDNRLATHVVRKVKTIYMLIYNAYIRQSPLNVARTTTPPYKSQITGKKMMSMPQTQVMPNLRLA